MKEEVADNRIWFGADGTGVPRIKRFLGDAKQGLTPSTMWSAKDVGANEHAKKQLSQLFDGDVVFDSPKPVRLVDHMLSICTDNDHVDVVLDFFAGFGTTAHAVVARNAADGGNRRFVLVQLPEPLDPKAKEQKTAADYCDKLNKSRTIAELTKERLRRAAKKVCEDNPLFAGDLGFRVFKLDSSNIQTWDPDRADLAASLEAHAKNLKEDRTEQDILFELLLKLGLDLCVPIVQRHHCRQGHPQHRRRRSPRLPRRLHHAGRGRTPGSWRSRVAQRASPSWREHRGLPRQRVHRRRGQDQLGGHPPATRP